MKAFTMVVSVGRGRCLVWWGTREVRSEGQPREDRGLGVSLRTGPSPGSGEGPAGGPRRDQG